ncbi:Glutamine Synthetase [Nesidiocoris tenuis]|uniref:receptor protein serine/threonine kinase n=1 Tax=Nesidiocoris tenuis TaxID=355587 RepID=A0ABN7AQN0_9HEMI|nr:Glutamine Synthetase [Nesidiocoris tenuis]
MADGFRMSFDVCDKTRLFLGLGLLIFQVKYVEGMLCYCDGHCPDDQQNGTCVAKKGSKCFAAVEAVFIEDTMSWEPTWSYGCLPPEEAGFMQCKGHLVPHSTGKSIQCCNSSDLCNRELVPEYRAPRPSSPPVPAMSISDALPYIALLVSFSVCAIVFLVFFTCFYLKYKKKEESGRLYLVNGSKDAYLTSSHTLQDLIDQSSGSGSGLPLLVQRTIAKQIQMVRSVGKGRYGEVWLARWRGEKVAVKVFFTTEESSWFRETEIYQSVLMRHDNILGFIAADIKGTGSWTQMLLITDYHDCGSLYDVLRTTILEPQSLLLMARSAASGLAHLHTEIFGTRGKPAIAHRDIKSRNILVKRNGECAIADFGLAVRYISESNEIDITPNTRVGTRRYMAPEVLDETIDTRSFDAFKMADMYSMSLVFWEMCRRCVTTGGGEKWGLETDEYELPFYDVVPSDPSFEDMYLAVCTKRIRPHVPQRWNNHQITATLSKIMQECWHPNPAVRLTSLRVKKTLCKLDPDPSIKIV